MAGVNTILRIIGAAMSLTVIIFVTGVGVTLYEPINKNIGAPSPAGWADVNWLFFMSLGLIGLTIAIIIWLIVAPIRQDVRQEVRRP
jgi:uncharacterized membrane protein (UPF0182 family)